MQKLNILILVALLGLFACQESTETTEETPSEETVVEEETPAQPLGTVEIPDFESPELVEFAKNFEVFFNESLAYMKEGNQEGLKALEAKGNELQAQSEALQSKVSEKDKVLLEEFLKAKATEMLQAAGLGNIEEKIKEESSK